MLFQSLSAIPNDQVAEERIVVVGGGTTGLYLARELAVRGFEVLVIESGGRVLDNFSPNSFASVGRVHSGIKIGRSRSLGGTSNLWGGQLVEFQPCDFEKRGWLPESGWPLGFKDVADYYPITYKKLGLPDVFLTDCEILARVGNAAPTFANDIELFLTRWMNTPSTARLFEKDIKVRSNFKVLIQHTVTGFEISDGIVRALRVVGESGRQERVVGRCIVLASGTIETCRLMLHAASCGIGECPWRQNTNVGAYFQDHLGGRVGSVQPLDKKRFFDMFSTIIVDGQKFQPKLRIKNETLRREPLLNIQASFIFESSIGENLIYLKQFLKAAILSRRLTSAGDLLRNLHACRRHLLPLIWRYAIDNRVFVPGDSKISLGVQVEQRAVKESKITIDPQSRDNFGLSKVVLDWRIGGEEIASIGGFARRCGYSLESAGLARLDLDRMLVCNELGFSGTLQDMYHQSGGTRMADSATSGVVDHNLKVFGTKNLYVLGASVFPTTSNANTTFTALTLGSRLVDHLSSFSAP